MSNIIEMEAVYRSLAVDGVACEFANFEIPKENIATVYDLLKVNTSGGWKFGNDLSDTLIDEFEKAPEKRLLDYLNGSFGSFVTKVIDDFANKPEEIVSEIQKKIAPMSIEEAYKGQLNKIIDSIMNYKFSWAVSEISDEFKFAKETEGNKKLFLAMVSKDDTYSGEEKEKLMELLSRLDYKKLDVDEEGNLVGDDPDIKALNPYIKYIVSLFPSAEEFEELTKLEEKDWLIDQMTFETASNMKKLCDEIKEKVKEVPSIPDATYEKPIIEEKEAEVRKMADLLRADPDLFEKVKELIGDKM